MQSNKGKSTSSYLVVKMFINSDGHGLSDQ